MQVKNKFITQGDSRIKKNPGFPRSIFSLFIAGLLLTVCSCKKFVEVDPPKTLLAGSAVFTSDATATAAVSGMYSQMVGWGFMDFNGMFYPGLSADELTNFSTVSEYIQINGNAISTGNTAIADNWTQLYHHINQANSIIEGLEASTSVTAPVKKQLEGEAKFIRAYCHFYLVNLFGDVPYITTTDYRANSLVSRTPKAEVYQKIIADLLDAQNLLAANYSYS